jgi:hypothetical protein
LEQEEASGEGDGRGVAHRGWHIVAEPGGVTVSRALPVRWDVAAETRLPAPASGLRPLRVAHQVRQDVWRVLRRQRGFAPAVRAVAQAGGLAVRAGGRVAAAHDRARLEAVLAEVLGDPVRRRRWLACAAMDPRAGRGAR